MEPNISETIKRGLIEELYQLPYEVQVGLVTGLGMRLMIEGSADSAQANG